MFSVSKVLRRFPPGSCCCVIKHISRNPRKILVPELDDEVLQGLNNGNMSSKKHPGKVPRELTFFDDSMLEALRIMLKDVPIKTLVADAATLYKYLKFRHPPTESTEYHNIRADCANEIMSKMPKKFSELVENKFERAEKVFTKKVDTLVKQRIYNWTPVNYTSYVGKQYLLGRMICEAAALNRIFSEIALRDPEFEPTTLFDFGSGVGTVTWTARRRWPGSIEESYNVDSSADMNQLAELLMKEDDKCVSSPIPNVFYRQFLPARSDIKYKLVVCSYTLFELPSFEVRLKTLMNLWNKTDTYLVLVEQGTENGFKLIDEAREFLLYNESSKEGSSGIHVFSPCPHEFPCPLVQFSHKPCRFKASYMVPPIGKRKTVLNEYYSFVVFKKGKRPENEKVWPRSLRPASKKKNRARCRICSVDGKLRFITLSKTKHGRHMVEMLRNCKSCDRLPMNFQDVSIDFDNDEEEVKEILTAEDISEDFTDEESSDDESDSIR